VERRNASAGEISPAGEFGVEVAKSIDPLPEGDCDGRTVGILIGKGAMVGDDRWDGLR
jgi:hypothetical protein